MKYVLPIAYTLTVLCIVGYLYWRMRADAREDREHAIEKAQADIRHAHATRMTPPCPTATDNSGGRYFCVRRHGHGGPCAAWPWNPTELVL